MSPGGGVTVGAAGGPARRDAGTAALAGRRAQRRAVRSALLALVLVLGGVLLWSTPAEAQTTPRILVSNVAQTGDDSLSTSGNDHAQLFHTAGATNGYVLTSLTVVSEDTQGDDFIVEICEADDDGFPTSTCTLLLEPDDFTAGNLEFTHPGILLSANTNYVAVFKQSDTGSVTLDTTTSGGQDATGLSGWSIKDNFSWNDGTVWADATGEAVRITVNGHATPANTDATGRPRVLASAEGARYLFADTFDIADGNGLPFTGSVSSTIEFTYSYKWIRVDGGTETNIGSDSPRYELVDADIGKQIKVEVSFTDRNNYSESVTSLPFSPIAEPASSRPPSTLVSNTGQSTSAVANITQQYAMEFMLGSHGQGYEISSVSLELAAVPSALTVSLWIGDHSALSSGQRTKLFDFENPDPFAVGLNNFTAPADLVAYPRVRYYIVLSGFGASLSINETTSDAEDEVGETGATLSNSAGGNSSVLRLAVEGSRRASGILASTYTRPVLGGQEIISVGDNCCFQMGAGEADRYLVRGFSWRSDDTTSRFGGITNPWYVLDGTDDDNSAKLFRLIMTRNQAGITEWTAPQGATVAGGSSKTYAFSQDLGDPYGLGSGTRTGSALTRILSTAIGNTDMDAPPARGVTLSDHGDIAVIQPIAAVLGEPLHAMVQNLGQADNSHVSLGGTNKVLSQGFTTGSDPDGYRLQGVGVNIEGSDSSGNPQVPDDATSVSVSVHADSGSVPGTKLFDLVSPTEYGPGHSFFEAPRGTHLDPSTSYHLVWSHLDGTGHRLQQTSSNGEDSGGLTGSSILNAFRRGADLDNLSQDSGGNALEIAVYTEFMIQNATGRPRILASAEGAPVLFADTFDIADADGLPFTGSVSSVIEFTYSYKWIRVDGDTETYIGSESPRYHLVDADTGKQIKVEVSYIDRDGWVESVTSLPFSPIAGPAPSRPATTLVSNTGQSATAVATITQQYAMELRLGSHGQGYEISSVSLELAAVPSALTVSLWIGDHSSRSSAPRIKLFDFENPDSFVVGLNNFTAPAGMVAYQSVRYYIVLSDFGNSLSIKETTSDQKDSGGESGAALGRTAVVRALSETGSWSASTNSSRDDTLRLAVEGSRRVSGILASTYAQVSGGDQEIISVGDDCCFRMGAGEADRYLVRGFSWRSDDTTSRNGGITNPWYLLDGTSDTSTKLFRLTNTRNQAGITEHTAPRGATVAGGSSRTYTFDQDLDDPYGLGKNTRTGAALSRIHVHNYEGYDAPSARGVTLSQQGDIAYPHAPYLAVLGEQLYAMAQNLDQTANGFASVGGAGAKVVSQGFTTGPRGTLLVGIGVNIEGSDSNGDPQVPDRAVSVSVSVHADSNGKPGTKLFDLVSPAEYAPGHSFFEAPAGTTLDPDTSYVVVWSHLGGTMHRLYRTTSNAEDAGGLPNFGISDSFYLGADVNNLTEDSNSNALRIAVYTSRDITPPRRVTDFDLHSSNSAPRGIWGNQTTFWVANDGTGAGSKLYAYNRSDGSSDTSADFDTLNAAGNNDIRGICSNGTTMFVTDHDDDKIYAYKMSDTTRDSAKDLTLHSTNDNPKGLWCERNVLWVAQDNDDLTSKIFGYWRPDPTNISEPDIDASVLSPSTNVGSLSNSDPRGLWSNGTTMFAVDGEDAKVYAYRLSDRTGDTGKNLALASANTDPEGLWFDGRVLWVVDSADGKVYTYDLPGAYAGNDPAAGDPVVASVGAQPRAGEVVDADVSGITDDTDGLDNVFFHYQWIRVDGTDETELDGETGETYTTTDDDVDKHLKVRVVFDDGAGYREYPRTSPQVGPVLGPPPEVTVAFEMGALSVAEGSTVSVKVTLNMNPERTVTIPITKTNKNGASNADYSGVPASVTFDDGDTEKSFTFSAVDDTVDDDGEQVLLGFGATLPAGVAAGAISEATVSIVDDDDPAVTVSFDRSSYSVAEGSAVSVKVTLNMNPERTVTIPITKTNKNGASNADYSGVPASVTFDDGDTEKSFTVTAAQDTVDDDGEQVLLGFGATLPDGVAAGAISEATVSIVDDDDPEVTVSFDRSSYSVAEGSAVSVKVTLNMNPERTVTIPITKTNENGASNADYSGVPASVTFDDGDTEKSFTFSAASDSVTDTNESVKLGFGATLPARVTAGTTSETTVSIGDNSFTAVTVSFDRSSYSVAEGSAVSVKVTLNMNPERTVTIPITETNENGASNADYSGVPASVTFNDNDTEKSFTFTAVDDTVDDDGEQVLLGFGATLPDAVAAGATSEATVSIVDDDDPEVTVSFDRSSYSVAEGSAVSVKVTLNMNPERTVTIPITKTNENGASNADYSGVPASVTFDDGDTEKSFTFSAASDSVTDTNESVKLGFGATLPARVTAGTTSETTVSIGDNSFTAVTVAFDKATYSVAEGSTVSVKVTLNMNPERTVVIPITAVHENDASNADYSGVPASVTFNDGDTEKSFTFTAAQDTVDDDGEQVLLGFGATLPAGVSLGITSETTVSIVVDDTSGGDGSFGGGGGGTTEPEPEPVRDYFVDDDGSIHETNINLIAAAGITVGCNPPDSDRYCLTEAVTRAQMATFLARALDLPEADTDYFVDDDGSIHETNINKIAAAGKTVGCNPPASDRFCPNEAVTRARMATFLARALGLPDSDTDYFVDDDGSIHEASINKIAAAGITVGCNPPDSDRYCLTEPVTRAQMASFLARALDLP